MMLWTTSQRLTHQVTHNRLTATQILQSVNVDVVGKVQGKRRATLPAVIALQKGASIFKLLRVPLTNVGVLDVKTRMERARNE